MSLVSLSDANARVGDAVTQDNIDEVEEQLASLIGPLIGERTETFLLSEYTGFRSIDGLYLSRYADSVSLTHDGDTLTSGTDFRFLNHHVIERVTGSTTSWTADLVATYTPNDEERIRGVIFDWLTYRQTPVGVQSIRIGAYSETYYPTSGSRKSNELATVADPVLSEFLRRILPDAGLGLTSPFRFRGTRRNRTLITGGAGS
jgi:hypothetical protein